MKDFKFALWISSIFLIPLIGQSFIFIFWIISIVFKLPMDETAVPTALYFFSIFLPIFLLSFIAVKSALFLARNRYRYVALLRYIFLTPQLFVLWQLSELFTGFPYSGMGTEGLGLMMLLPVIFVQFFVFMFYFLLISDKVSEVLKSC